VISKCATLISLNLDLKSNSIGEKGGKYLGEGIAKCITLTSLNLNLKVNNLGKHGSMFLG